MKKSFNYFVLPLVILFFVFSFSNCSKDLQPDSGLTNQEIELRYDPNINYIGLLVLDVDFNKYVKTDREIIKFIESGKYIKNVRLDSLFKSHYKDGFTKEKIESWRGTAIKELQNYGYSYEDANFYFDNVCEGIMSKLSLVKKYPGLFRELSSEERIKIFKSASKGIN